MSLSGKSHFFLFDKNKIEIFYKKYKNNSHLSQL